MIIVDSALRRLEEKGEPICIGMVGAGAMGRAIAFDAAVAPDAGHVVDDRGRGGRAWVLASCGESTHDHRSG